MRNLKKFLAVILAIAVIATTMVPAFAADATYAAEAEALVELGLISGGDLDQTLTREQGITIALKLGGYQDEADAITDEEIDEILADVKDADKISSWARGWMAIGIETGIVSGDGNGYVEPDEPFIGAHLATVILKIMNYTVANWMKATVDLANIGGLTPAEILFTDVQLTRDAAFGMMYAALSAEYEDGTTLIEGLVADGLVDEDLALELGLIAPATIVSVEDIEATVKVGAEYTLPAEVEATMSDDTTATVAVTWEPAEVDTSKVGTVEAVGTIDGYDAGITATITVEADPLTAEVAADNLKEVVVTFSKPVDKTAAETEGNYAIKVGTASKGIKTATAIDEKTVLILLADGVSFSQQDKVDITLKKALGFDADTVVSIASVVDTTIPKVESVTVAGNKLIKVYFSEPVQEAAAEVLGNYKIDNKFFAASLPELDATGKVVSIRLTNGLTAAAHTLTVNSNVKDYAPYSVYPNSGEFVVAADTTDPSVELVSASQTKLVVKFSEEVETISSSNVVTSVSTVKDATTPVSLADDKMTFTVNFDIDGALPLSGCTVTFKNVKDFSGNIAETLTLVVIPTPDVDRPEFVSLTADGQTSLIVEYNEDVDLDATAANEYEVTDPDGNKPAINTAYYIDGDTYKNKVVITLQSGTFAAGEWAVYMKNVSDLNPLRNKLLSRVETVTVSDSGKPTVAHIYRSGTTKLFVEFSEAVDSSLATTLANYSYLDGNIMKSMPSDAVISLLGDGKTVMIDFTNCDPVFNISTAIDALQVASVADTAGNVMVTSGTAGAFTDIAGNIPAITDVWVSGANTIVVQLNRAILASTLTPSDFVIEAGVYNITAIDATFNADNNRITLTTSETLSSDGEYEGNAITLSTIATPNVVDVYGAALDDATGVPVVDRYAPYATAVTAVYDISDTETVITVALSENITPSGATLSEGEKIQFVVLVDGVAQSLLNANTDLVAEYVDAAGDEPAKITFTFDNVNWTDSEVTVKFFAAPGTTLDDAALDKLGAPAPNDMVNFDITATCTSQN